MTYGAKLEALAPPTRRAVFERLAQGSASVGEIAGELPVSRPAVSQHLKILKDAGLVTETRDGVRRVYAVNPVGLAEIRDYFDRFWDEALDNYKRSVEASDG